MANILNVIPVIVEELLNSTSSSSDDDDTFLPKENVSKINNYIGDVVRNYSDYQFKRAFRVERRTATYLIDDFSQSIYYNCNKGHGGLISSSPENHILSFIWFASNKCCIRDVAERFGIGQTSCFRQIIRVMDYLVSVAPTFITFPKTDLEKEEMANEFKKISGFPNVLGCIDGSSITICTPANKIKSTYVNRHDIPSVTLQGICDYKRRFLDVFTGPPGKIHDSRVHKLSFISKELPDICGQRYHLLGDNAYSLRLHLLTPYKDYGALTEPQRHYNYTLSKTRVLIENTFGILKNRFRQLSSLYFHKVDKISKFIVATCVLHNLCIGHDDYIEDIDGNLDDQNNQNEDMNGREVYLRNLGEMKRNELCTTLFNDRNQ